MNAKKIISGILSAALALSMAACSAAPATTEQPAAQPAQTQTQAAAETPKQEAAAPETQPAAQQVESAKAPKYVFLFIGDGMSYPQFQAASDYLGALADSENFTSLTDEQVAYWLRRFAKPEFFVNVNGQIICVPVEEPCQ